MNFMNEFRKRVNSLQIACRGEKQPAASAGEFRFAAGKRKRVLSSRDHVIRAILSSPAAHPISVERSLGYEGAPPPASCRNGGKRSESAVGRDHKFMFTADFFCLCQRL